LERVRYMSKQYRDNIDQAVDFIFGLFAFAVIYIAPWLVIIYVIGLL